MTYTPTDWKDGETWVDEEHLDKMEAGIAAAEEKALKGQPNGYAALGPDGVVPSGQLPPPSVSGPAGGDLSGSYPNPQIAAGVIVDGDVAAANKDGAPATPSLRTLGTGAQQAAPGNDSRFSDSRPPSGAAGGDLGGSYPNPTVVKASGAFQAPSVTGLLRPTNLSNAPSSPAKGELYLDTDDNTLYWWDGTAWISGRGGAAIPPTLIDAKGDLIVGTAPDVAGRLGVGSDGQLLTADAAQPSGVKWAAAPVSGIPPTLLDAKGDLIAASANDVAARLAVGSNGQVLMADSAQATGIKWAAAPGAPVYEQPGQPSDTTVGALWIDTDEQAPQLWGPPLVTSLPGNPVDGQEVYYLADATNGVIWHLRYRAASASPYKWEFLGGSELHSAVAAAETTNSTGAFVALTTAGPAVTLPLAGDYDVDIGATSEGTSNNSMSFDRGATGAVDADAVLQGDSSSTPRNSVRRTIRVTGMAASATLTAKYKAGNAANCYWRDRYMRVRPVRVG